jgi:hypothetical protein
MMIPLIDCFGLLGLNWNAYEQAFKILTLDLRLYCAGDVLIAFIVSKFAIYKTINLVIVSSASE